MTRHGPQYHASHGWEDFDPACIECEAFRGMQDRKRLEAAAPELLAALEALLTEHAYLNGVAREYGRGVNTDGAHPDCPADVARAAIARAKGGES